MCMYIDRVAKGNSKKTVTMYKCVMHFNETYFSAIMKYIINTHSPNVIKNPLKRNEIDKEFTIRHGVFHLFTDKKTANRYIKHMMFFCQRLKVLPVKVKRCNILAYGQTTFNGKTFNNCAAVTEYVVL